MGAFLLHPQSFSVGVSQSYLQVKSLFPWLPGLSVWFPGLVSLFVYLTDYILFLLMILG